MLHVIVIFVVEERVIIPVIIVKNDSAIITHTQHLPAISYAPSHYPTHQQPRATIGSMSFTPKTDGRFVKVFINHHGGQWAWFVDTHNHKTNTGNILTGLHHALTTIPTRTPLEIISPLPLQTLLLKTSHTPQGAHTARALHNRQAKTVFTIQRGESPATITAATIAQRYEGEHGPGWTRPEERRIASVVDTGASVTAPKKSERTHTRRQFEGSMCDSCGRTVNPLTLRCGCFSD